MMKNFVIKKLSISNFKGQTRVFTPHEIKTYVKGANGVGKTTLYKAFCWLLTSYTDPINVKNHELFDSRLELTHETPEAVVSAIVSIDDVEYTIERRAKAKFTRKRGSQEWTKDASDSYTILIDDIETSASDFNAWLERNIGKVELIPYMLIGERFANLVIDDKKAARKILEQITGEVTIDMMKGDYSMIEQDLKKYPIEQLLERYKAQLKPLNQRIATIDALMETKENDLGGLDATDFDFLETRINEKTDEIGKVDQCILDASKTAEPLVCERERLIKEIHVKSVELGDKRFEYDENVSNDVRELKRKIANVDETNKEIKAKNKDAKDQYDYVCSLLDAESKALVSFLKQREILVTRRNEVKARVFDDDECPYCGQTLPSSELAKEREKFNKKKDEDLNGIINEGKILKEKIELSNKRIAEWMDVKNQGYVENPLVDKDELLKELELMNKKCKPFEETEEYRKIESEINDLKSKMPDINTNTDELTELKAKLMEELQELNREYGKKAVKDGIIHEISAMKEEKRNLGSEIARIEGCVATIHEYEEERARIISDKINEKLDDCKVVMYSRQKDGTLKPDCVVVNNDGVKYATLNNSARISTCLSLQRMLCKHFGINLPIFIDEASVFDTAHLPSYEAQTIYLFASDDKTLKVE